MKLKLTAEDDVCAWCRGANAHPYKSPGWYYLPLSQMNFLDATLWLNDSYRPSSIFDYYFSSRKVRL